MNVLAIFGSRNPEGQTARAGNAFLEGVTAAGGTVERVFLTESHLEHCQQCDINGWGTCRSAGACQTQDDFASIVEKVVAADGVVFVNPVYFGDLSESMRAFTDRLRRISFRNEVLKSTMAEKPTVGICIAGGGGGGAPTAIVSLEKVLRTIGLDVVDLVPCRRQNLDLKVTVLRTTGEWFARQPQS